MCRHIYTKHICGHKSVKSEQCELALMPTAVLFCEKYDVAQEQSLRPCCFVYCEEEKEVAYWVQEGPSQLAACDEEIADLKRRLDMCQKEMKILAWYQVQWGPLQREKEVQRAHNLQTISKELQQTLGDRKEKHKNIVAEMTLTREKLNKSAESIAQVMAQFERTTIQILQQSAMSELQPLPTPSSQHPMVTEPQSLPQLASKTIPVISSHHPGGSRQLRPAPPQLSSNPLNTPLSPTNAVDLTPAKNVTPRKPAAKRGRPRKVKETKKPPAPPTDVSRTPASNRKRKAELQRQPSSGTRRSGRLETKKQVSYAESSESATPEPSPSKVAKTTPQRSTATRRRSKRVQDDDTEDDVLFEDANDSDDDDDEVGNAIDDDWRDLQPQADMEFEPVKKTRASNKRLSNSSTKTRPRKRQAAAAPTAPKARTQPARSGARARIQSGTNQQSKPGVTPSAAYSAWLNTHTPVMNVSAAQWREATTHTSTPQDFSFLDSKSSFSVSEADQGNYVPHMPTFIPNPLAGNMGYGTMEPSRGGYVPDAMAGAPDISQLQQFDIPPEDLMAFDFGDVPYYDMNVDYSNEYANLGAQEGSGM